MLLLPKSKSRSGNAFRDDPRIMDTWARAWLGEAFEHDRPLCASNPVGTAGAVPLVTLTLADDPHPTGLEGHARARCVWT